MRRWENWEAETRTLEYQFSKDPRRFQLTHQTSFGKRHLRYWTEHSLLRWPTCFLRQFYGSVSKVDYLTLRHGFITAHFEQGTNFDFQKYIKRALEKDFGVVVGIRYMYVFGFWALAELLSTGILHLDLVQIRSKIMLPPRNRGYCHKACHGSVGTLPLWLCNTSSICSGHTDGHFDEEKCFPR
ncbi:hypothetical protein GH714_002739 [Hevea brasiliensis]|uniref:Uncharacterized protein n=1 Tax=Hevea brasiliensis TaxID=3981 RepID=A0A6A6LUS5_HEVBR|nr:hypothetical protein GH714_002739 [Hevea brasiliensis]